MTVNELVVAVQAVWAPSVAVIVCCRGVNWQVREVGHPPVAVTVVVAPRSARVRATEIESVEETKLP